MERRLQQEYKGFVEEKLDNETVKELEELARLARGDILKMTTLAQSGHPGGSMSSIDFYLTLYSFANVFPDDPHHPDRDRIVISHGHTSPGVYAALGRVGFFDTNGAVVGFRKAGSIFEGHVERKVPGVEWSTGNLGQGLSAGCGFALAARLLERDFHVFVAMSDGEQQKGQVSEARRFAKKYGLSNLTVIMDRNRIQLSGFTEEIMPQKIRENFLSDDWGVIEIDGHDFQEIYRAFHQTIANKEMPMAIIANTTMGKGVSFMEDRYEYHGKALSLDEFQEALQELNLVDDLDYYKGLRTKWKPPKNTIYRSGDELRINKGNAHTYKVEEKLENRKAFGNALKNIAELNCGQSNQTPIAVFDCDLVESVRTDGFAEAFSDYFFEGGIQEHNTSAIAGALSTQGVVTFFADFGVFGIDETYNQHRLNDINEANLKLVCTHNGLDVGEDGKTHQCLDYVAAFNNFFGYKVVIPADPNQTDRVIRFIASQEGNYAVAVGRSKLPVIATDEGKPFFGEGYQFQYGKIDIVRDGNRAAIITMGTMLHRAIQAWEKLEEKGIKVRVLNVSCPKDLEGEVLEEAAQTGSIITYEDHNVRTGLGSIVANFLAENSLRAGLRKLGVAGYASSGSHEELFEKYGLDADSLVKVVLEEIQKTS